ncbi:HTH-type transcriptional regulator ybiH [Salmonella enterica subsp. enterica]|nr:HTH-type transcriptional regulator ybiH [Salmonella enterica subsp. enterica]
MIMLLTQEDTVNLSKFISREQLSPTSAYQLVHEQVIDPLHTHLTRLVAAYTGCDANDTRMILHTHALLGEVLAFRLGKENYSVTYRLAAVWIEEKSGADLPDDNLPHRSYSARFNAKGVWTDEKNLSLSDWQSQRSSL